ncbi:SCO6745 family protein [Janibacter alittae]|uniref:SalK n=1 Tax=Janibacter alittae TaxID=3115209 RepID=A0ABZ2MHJ6_9MICO
MDPHDAGRTARSLETLHAFGYFAPEVQEELTQLGLRKGRQCYFTSRSAPMGALSSGTVAATFFVFNPSLVAHHMSDVWTRVSPQEVTAARYRGISAGWQRLLPDLAPDDLAEAAELARSAARACSVAGRPLSAAHADLPWPQEPHLVLFHALTILREHRGDGHVAALLGEGLSGLEALVTHTATGRGFTVSAAKATRGWSDDEWDAAVTDLVDRGVMTPEGGLTEAGRALRREIEAATDRMASDPWQALGEERATRLAELGRPWVRQALANGAFPEGVFA